MKVFADSSALVKRYVDEPGSDLVRTLDALAVSALARVEVPTALWRKTRMQVLTAPQTGLLLREFEADWYGVDDVPLLSPVEADEALLEEAAVLVGRHGLRAYDAVQLASAGVARRAVPDLAVFACFDDGLRAAAVREGWHLLPSTAA